MSTSIVIAETAAAPAVVAVGVVADDDVVRQRLVNLVSSIGHVSVSHPAADVVLYGCHSFRSVEADAVRTLRREHNHVALLVISRGEDAARVRHALEAGASGYVASDEVSYALAPAIAVVAAGQMSLPPAYRRQIAKPTFTTREKQILGLVVMGMSNGEIGRKLYLAESTVKSHLSSAFNKLGVRSRNEATALILDPGSGLGPGILRITEDLPGTKRLLVK